MTVDELEAEVRRRGLSVGIARRSGARDWLVNLIPPLRRKWIWLTVLTDEDAELSSSGFGKSLEEAFTKAVESFDKKKEGQHARRA